MIIKLELVTFCRQKAISFISRRKVEELVSILSSLLSLEKMVSVRRKDAYFAGT